MIQGKVSCPWMNNTKHPGIIRTKTGPATPWPHSYYYGCDTSLCYRQIWFLLCCSSFLGYISFSIYKSLKYVLEWVGNLKYLTLPCYQKLSTIIFCAGHLDWRGAITIMTCLKEVIQSGEESDIIKMKDNLRDHECVVSVWRSAMKKWELTHFSVAFAGNIRSSVWKLLEDKNLAQKKNERILYLLVELSNKGWSDLGEHCQ